MNNRVVITQMNCITAQGLGTDILKKLVFELEEGAEARKPDMWTTSEQQIEVQAYKCDDMEYSHLLQGGMLRRLDRFAKLNVAALRELNLDEFETSGYIMGTSFGTWASSNQYTMELIDEGPEFASPRLFPNTVLNAAQGQVTIYYQIKGEVSTVSGVNSLTYGFDLIKRGVTNRVIVAGAEEISENLVECYKQMNCNICLGEAVGVIVLEAEEYAINKGRNIICEVVDYCTRTDINMVERVDQCDPEANILKYISNKVMDNKDADSTKTCMVLAANGAESLEKSEELLVDYWKNVYKKDIDCFNVKTVVGETMGASAILNSIIGAIAISDYKYDEAYVFDYQLGGNQTAVKLINYVERNK